MKVNRQSDIETNKTTAFWLYEFAHDLEKKAAGTDYLKEYLNKNYNNKKFNTIEEKLADIRERIGFNIATKIVEQIEKNSQDSKESKTAKKESGCGCGKSCKKCKGDCNCEKECSCSVKTASKKNKSSKKNKKSDLDYEEQVMIMDGIIKYIKEMVSHEPHLPTIVVLDRCRSQEGLRYQSIEKNIDHDMLKSFIETLFSQRASTKYEPINYVPNDSTAHNFSYNDSVAEYYNHAEPHRN
jgi:hypothetical protein